nr:non capsid protein NS 1 [Hymenolepis microstoma]
MYSVMHEADYLSSRIELIVSKWLPNSALHGSVSSVDYLRLSFADRACFRTHCKWNLLTSCLLWGEGEEEVGGEHADQHVHTGGIVCQRGEQKAFHFENLLNRTVALIEEPLITIETKNDYKCLLGGERLEIDIKCGARRFLQRVPVIVTTNEDLGSQLTSLA